MTLEDIALLEIIRGNIKYELYNPGAAPAESDAK